MSVQPESWYPTDIPPISGLEQHHVLHTAAIRKG